MSGNMGGVSRRRLLKVSGTLLGGIAVGSEVVAAEQTNRFIAQVKRNADLSGLDVVHDLREEIGVAVVEGTESDVESISKDFAPDTFYELDLPEPASEPVEPTSEAHDEPYYGFQWDKQSQDIPEAHEVTRGEGTRVAVIDTGVAANHPDLAHAVNATLSRDFTGDGNGAPGPWGGYHGTHVAGIIAADDENDVGALGTAPATDIVDCRVFSGTDPGASFADILAAMVYSAAVGSDVANLSLGAYPIPRQGLGQFYGKVLNFVTAYCRRQGTLLVIAAGNDAADLQHDGSVISLPNEAANVMSISATGPIGFGWGDAGLEAPPSEPAVYTNYGTNAIDVSAPGGNYDPEAAANDVPGWYFDLVFNAISLPQFDSDGNAVGSSHFWAWVAGTSMAAPQVAGAAALVKSANPVYSANKVRSTLTRTAKDVGDKEYHGAGHLDPNAAVRD